MFLEGLEFKQHFVSGLQGKTSIKGLIPPLPEPLRVKVADLVNKGMLSPETLGFVFPDTGKLSWVSVTISLNGKTLVETTPVLLKNGSGKTSALYRLSPSAAKAIAPYYQAGYEISIRVEPPGFDAPVELVSI